MLTPLSEAAARVARESRYRILYQAQEAFLAAQHATLREIHELNQLIRGTEHGIPLHKLATARRVFGARGVLPSACPPDEIGRVLDLMIEVFINPAEGLASLARGWFVRLAPPEVQAATWLRTLARAAFDRPRPAIAFDVYLRDPAGLRTLSADDASDTLAVLYAMRGTSYLIDLLSDAP